MPKQAKASKYNLRNILIVVAVLVLSTGLVAAKKLITPQQAQVYEVRGMTPPKPSPTPVPTSCVVQVASITGSAACSTTGFKSISYQCLNGKKFSTDSSRSPLGCTSMAEALKQAEQNCGIVCKVTPTPTPTPTPKGSPIPISTSTPTASAKPTPKPL